MTPYGLPFPNIRGFATPTQNCNLKSRENECTKINSLYGKHKIFWEIESVGISRESRTAQIFWVPQLSQERVKLQTLNFVRTFIGSSTTKAHEKMGIVRESRKFLGHPYMGHSFLVRPPGTAVPDGLMFYP